MRVVLEKSEITLKTKQVCAKIALPCPDQRGACLTGYVSRNEGFQEMPTEPNSGLGPAKIRAFWGMDLKQKSAAKTALFGSMPLW